MLFGSSSDFNTTDDAENSVYLRALRLIDIDVHFLPFRVLKAMSAHLTILT